MDFHPGSGWRLKTENEWVDAKHVLIEWSADTSVRRVWVEEPMSYSDIDTRDMRFDVRFNKGDRIRVRDAEGHILCEGIALHTRRVFGAASFQVWVGSEENGWAREFNLNYVRVDLFA